MTSNPSTEAEPGASEAAPPQEAVSPPAGSSESQHVDIPGILPASHWQPLPRDDDDDADSTRGSIHGSTVSLSDSITEYREILGRTYHHNIGNAEGWNPNDEKHADAMDIFHNVHTLLYDGKLHMAPLDDNIQKVLDVGTGTGIWACEFGDLYPSAEVIGTELSPMQPDFVPPNVRFEIDNAEAEWTWDDDTFDFIHIRTLTGSIKDWDRLYEQAFRCLKPGGWLEHHENSIKWACQNNTITEDSALGQWHKVLWRAGELMGQTFKVVDDDIQKPGMERVGFVNLNVRDLKAPYGDWAQGRTDRAIGNFSKLTFDKDPEGWVLYMWNTVLGWTHDEARVYIAYVRNQLNHPRAQHYINHRVVWGQKPQKDAPEDGPGLQEPTTPMVKPMMPIATGKVPREGKVEAAGQVQSH